jgi:hypothetical protein
MITAGQNSDSGHISCGCTEVLELWLEALLMAIDHSRLTQIRESQQAEEKNRRDRNREAQILAEAQALDQARDEADRVISNLQLMLEDWSRCGRTGGVVYSIESRHLAGREKNRWFGDGLSPSCLPEHAKRVWDYCERNGLRPVLRNADSRRPWAEGRSWYGVAIIVSIR